MIEKTNGPRGPSGQVDLWYCNGCKAVHLGVGETRVSFDKLLFSEFVEMVADVHYESLAGSGIFDITDLSRGIEVELPGG